mmetsp:Transcript_7372/g.21751  ORF Transcript_7372/g.21751 Transcript_7372/m.21751 type:complete len:207 (+) Transcript_7372:46-666(+)
MVWLQNGMENCLNHFASLTCSLHRRDANPRGSTRRGTNRRHAEKRSRSRRHPGGKWGREGIFGTPPSSPLDVPPPPGWIGCEKHHPHEVDGRGIWGMKGGSTYQYPIMCGKVRTPTSPAMKKAYLERFERDLGASEWSDRMSTPRFESQRSQRAICPCISRSRPPKETYKSVPRANTAHLAPQNGRVATYAGTSCSETSGDLQSSS